jgi:hypothetical protein
MGAKRSGKRDKGDKTGRKGGGRKEGRGGQKKEAGKAGPGEPERPERPEGPEKKGGTAMRAGRKGKEEFGAGRKGKARWKEFEDLRVQKGRRQEGRPKGKARPETTEKRTRSGEKNGRGEVGGNKRRTNDWKDKKSGADEIV